MPERDDRAASTARVSSSMPHTTMLDTATSMAALPAHLPHATSSPHGLPMAPRQKGKERQSYEMFSSGEPSSPGSLYDAFVAEVPSNESEVTPATERNSGSIMHKEEMDKMMGTFAVSDDL